jgi:hypothetical protein
MQEEEEVRRPPRAATAQPCLPERGGAEPGCCCVSGRVIPSTAGHRAVVEVCPSSGYSDHLDSVGEKSKCRVQTNEA